MNEIINITNDIAFINQNNVFDTIIIHTDGGYRYCNKEDKNGEMAIAFVVNFDNKYIYEYFKKIGVGSSAHIAEYSAFISAIEFLIKNNIKANLVVFKSDSLTTIDCIKEKCQIKNIDLILIDQKFKKLLQQIIDSKNIKNIEFKWIPREKNKRANELINKAFKNISDINIDDNDIDNTILINTKGICGKIDSKKTERRRMKLGFIMTTNNGYKYVYTERKGISSSSDVAEYSAIILVLEFYIQIDIKSKRIIFKSNSQLVVNQMNGYFSINRIKKSGLFDLYKKANELIEQLIWLKKVEGIRFQWIPTKQNKEIIKIISH